MLVMFHFSEGHGYRHFWPLDYLAARGYLWVEFFFCLSGFILTHVYGNAARTAVHGAGYGAFLKARLIRLYPLHLFMLLTVLMVLIVTRSLAALGHYPSIFDLKYHQDVSLKGFALSLVLMHGLEHHGHGSPGTASPGSSVWSWRCACCFPFSCGWRADGCGAASP